MSFARSRRPVSYLLALAAGVAAAGAVAAPASARVLADTTAPKVSISSPGSGATVSASFSVSGSASDNVALSKVEVRVDSNPYVTASGTTSWKLGINTASYSAGSHTITVRATDTSGNKAWASATYTFGADTTAPTVSISSPAAGATVSGTFAVSGTASDNVGLSKVEVRVDSNAYVTASGLASWQLGINAASYTTGSHTITVRATDTSGKQAWASRTYTFASVTTSLKVAISSPAAGATVSGTFTVSGTAADGVALSKVEVRVDSHPYVLASGTTSWQLAINAGSYASGSHTVTVRATDTLGKQAWASRSYTFSTSTTSGATGSIYWGGWVGDQFTGTEAPWDMTAATKFETMVGKGMSLIQFASPFANCSSSPCTFYSFPTSIMTKIRSHGSIPFFSWSSSSVPGSKIEPNFELRDIAAGNYDSYIRSFATAAKNWGHPFFLRFDWEMNGNWFSWNVGVNNNTAPDFVAAWRHVHNIFSNVGATNATWVWCPNIDYAGSPYAPLSAVYPGDSYVDWTCLDGYNWGTNPWKPNLWKPFHDVFSWTYTNELMRVAPSKPMVLGEVASTEYGGSKANWITDMLQNLQTYFPQLKAFVWTEKYDGNYDWPVETSSTSKSAFATGIKSSRYAGNSFAGLGGSKIQPLG